MQIESGSLTRAVQSNFKAKTVTPFCSKFTFSDNWMHVATRNFISRTGGILRITALNLSVSIYEGFHFDLLKRLAFRERFILVYVRTKRTDCTLKCNRMRFKASTYSDTYINVFRALLVSGRSWFGMFRTSTGSLWSFHGGIQVSFSNSVRQSIVFLE